MKKSTIWLLAIIMALTFGALLFFQFFYLRNMTNMREQQFRENVQRALNATSDKLEKHETRYYLEQDINSIEASLYSSPYAPQIGTPGNNNIQYSIENPDGTVTQFTLSSTVDETKKRRPSPGEGIFPPPTHSIGSRYQTMHEVLRGQYLYQKGLLDEVVLTILRESSSRPIIERADSTLVRNYLQAELGNNGLNQPFAFAINDAKNTIIYATQGFVPATRGDTTATYSHVLFPNSPTKYTLEVQFPAKKSYIVSSVRFAIPSLAFTLILLVVFLYTIVTAFRQKRLTEMKTDFINNMTHELKTPISSISLAAQMLDDSSVRKSPESLKRISGIISDEAKRLRFQVEKVLQMSVFDSSSVAALKFKEVDANSIVASVVNTFKLKVEKYGGLLDCELDAEDPFVRVDEMQFTNVIFNLLDNAVKYRRDDVDLNLHITTRNVGNNLEIRVSDNGIGIRRDDLKRIFDKFFRVHTGNRHDVKGFGLGLAYVKKMVTLFSGTIRVESELGKGTTFIITLPLLNTDAETE